MKSLFRYSKFRAAIAIAIQGIQNSVPSAIYAWSCPLTQTWRRAPCLMHLPRKQWDVCFMHEILLQFTFANLLDNLVILHKWSTPVWHAKLIFSPMSLDIKKSIFSHQKFELSISWKLGSNINFACHTRPLQGQQRNNAVWKADTITENSTNKTIEAPNMRHPQHMQEALRVCSVESFISFI